MKNYRLNIFFFILFLSYQILTAENYDKNPDSVIYPAGNGFIKMQVYSENIIRLSISPVKDTCERESLIILVKPEQDIKWKVKEDQQFISVITGKITARLNKKTLFITFFDTAGNGLLQSTKFSFGKKAVNSKKAYQIHQDFKLSPNEAIYGLGQLQEGVMNWRGYEVILFQKNREIAIPVFVSTKKYGTLCDNYSLTRFKDDANTMMRALIFDFNNDKNVYDISTEYIFGQAFLVQPVRQKMYYEKNYLGELIRGDVFYNKKGVKGNLTTEFYRGIDFDTLMSTDIRKKIDFNWNDGISRPKEVPEHYYSIRFSGEIQPDETGTYTFLTISNDEVRLTIDNQVIIENRIPHGATVNTGETEPKAGKKYRITLEYFHTLGGAEIKLTWIKPSIATDLKEQEVPPTQSVDVYLPETTGWYDFWRGDFFKGGQTVTTPAPIDEIPLYLKAGSVIPMGPFLQYADEKPSDPVKLQVYTNADSRFTIYEDEGNNYNYEKGVYATIPVIWNEKTQTLTIGSRKGSFHGIKRTYFQNRMGEKRTRNRIIPGRKTG